MDCNYLAWMEEKILLGGHFEICRREKLAAPYETRNRTLL